jgi:hypothetical protein
MVETEAEFLVEVTNRTKADVKVGIAYIRYPLQCSQQFLFTRAER